jgi:hypothetical protein
MSTMSVETGGTMRHTRRIGVIAAIVAAAGLLAGCSSSSDSTSDGGYGGDEWAVDAAYDGAAAPQEMGSDDAGTVVAPASDRSLIITGELYVTVEDPLAAADRAASIVQGAGGRIDGRNETAPQGRDGGSASLTLRIPASSLDRVVDDLRGLGTVDHFSTDARDVTTEVTDLDARISTLRESTDRIRGLLANAKDIKDIIVLEDELASRQAQLQSLEAQQRGLDDQVSMSTIYLSLTTEPVVIVDDSPQSFWDGLVSGWNGLTAFVTAALVVLGILLPWLAVAALLTFAAIATVRVNRGRARRKASAVAESAATTATSSAPPSPPSA